MKKMPNRTAKRILSTKDDIASEQGEGMKRNTVGQKKSRYIWWKPEYTGENIWKNTSELKEEEETKEDRILGKQ